MMLFSGKKIWNSIRFLPLNLMKDLCILISCLYPIYNLLKRMTYHNTEFSISSFSNNLSEWVFGYLFGLFLGLILSVLYHNKKIEEKLCLPISSGKAQGGNAVDIELKEFSEKQFHRTRGCTV